MAASAQEKTLKDVVKGFSHITLPVSNMATALRFYTEVLQMEQTGRIMSPAEIERAKREGTIRAPHVSVKVGNSPRIDLFEVNYPRPGLNADHPHYAFEVDGDNIDLCAEALRKASIPFDGPSLRGPRGGASLYFLDPFGNHLEYHCTTGYTGEVEDRPPVWDKRMEYTWPR